MVTHDGQAARGEGALCVLAALVGLHALVQIICVASAIFDIELYRGRAIPLFVLAVAVSLAFAYQFWEPPAPRKKTAKEAAAPALSRWAIRIAAAVALVWAGTLWARLWVLAFRRPPYDWDGLYYHIPAIHEWVRAGRVGWLSDFPDVPFVNYPMAVEAHTFLTHQVLGTTRLVNACNLWYWPLAFFAVVVLAGRLGAAGAWRWWAGALLLGAPVLVCQSVSCYVDPGFAASVMAAVAASVVLVFHDGRALWPKTVLWGASVGLALGAKGIGVPMTAAFFAAVFAGAIWWHGRRQLSEWTLRLVVAMCVALSVGGYWYVRNLYHTGNPVYPVELRIGYKVLAGGYDHHALMEDNVPPFLETYPNWMRPLVSWLQTDAPIQGYAPVGGMGYNWLFVELPVLLVLGSWAFWRRSHRPHAEIAFAIGLGLILLAAQPAVWWARFTLWLHVLGLSCLAVAVRRVSMGRGATRQLLASLCAFAILAVAIWESERTLDLEWQTGRHPQATTDGQTYISTQEMFFPGMDETKGFDRFLAAEKIGRSRWSRDGTLLGGTLAMPLGQREIHLLPVEPSEADILRLREAGVEWVIWDVVGAGNVPEVLGRNAVEEYRYSTGPEVDYRTLRLRDQ